MNERMKNCKHNMETVYDHDSCGEVIGEYIECEHCFATPEMLLIRKLKLERLMFKAESKMNYLDSVSYCSYEGR